jgi:uncharacterized heparinase superfamily protein
VTGGAASPSRVALGQRLSRLTARHSVVLWKDFASCRFGFVARLRQLVKPLLEFRALVLGDVMSSPAPLF